MGARKETVNTKRCSTRRLEKDRFSKMSLDHLLNPLDPVDQEKIGCSLIMEQS